MSTLLEEKITDVKIPYNIEAEQILLGSILVNNNILNRVNEYLRAEHFYEPGHQRIYKASLNIIEKGLSASPVTLKNIFDQDPGLDAVGGSKYLYKLATLASSVINTDDYARIIYDYAIKRELIDIGQNIVQDSYNPKTEENAFQLIEKAESNLYELASTGISEKSFIPITLSIDESLRQIEKAMKNSSSVTGITTGFLDLDKKLSGFHSSDLLILAGRPSMGKTAFAINLAVNACQDLYEKHLKNPNDPLPSVGFFSLEMSAEQLTTRMLSMFSKINSTNLRSGNIAELHYNELRKQAEALKKIPFFIDDTPALSIAAIRTRARRLKRKHNLSILFIDYLQLLRGSSNTESRVLEISEITQGLKALAKELNIPVIALSQLSRAVEQRDDKKPMLADLRESGAIEQDADIVMFIYREEYYLHRKTPPQEGTEKYEEWKRRLEKYHNVAEIIIAKHRNGPIGNVELFYDTNFSQFANLGLDQKLS